jgi:lipid-A-disaccharide synthase
MSKKILISAGEPSGDTHASRLIKELKALECGISFFGIGCAGMEAEGVRLLERMDKAAVVGVWEVFSKLSFIRGLFDKIGGEIDKEKPSLAILVDYPGFNMRLARMLKDRGIPVVYYITPQVWAWGAWRIAEIKKYVTKALTIFDFEREVFEKNGVTAVFTGHPLLDAPLKRVSKNEASSALGLDPDKFTVALLPGSRHLEIKNLMKVLLGAAAIISSRKSGVQFLVSKVPGIPKESYGMDTARGINVKMVETDINTCLSAADFVIACSGTVTLEVALAEKPMLITYITSPITYFFGRLFVTIPYIGLANIILRDHVVPELLQYEATPENIANASLEIISSDERMSRISARLKAIKSILGGPGASKRAARAVMEVLNGVSPN